MDEADGTGGTGEAAGGGFAAVVVAGGAGRRLGGADKPGLAVGPGGGTLLGRAVAACRAAGAGRVVVVGPRREVPGPVAWTREDPPGGGPVAALGAGLAALAVEEARAGGGRADVVVVLAADLPFVTADTVARLVAAVVDGGGGGGRGGTGRVDGALLRDAAGRDQYLTAAYAAASLRAGLDAHRAPGGGGLAGLPLRRALDGLRLVRLPDLDASAFDCDTWEDVAEARRRAANGR